MTQNEFETVERKSFNKLNKMMQKEDAIWDNEKRKNGQMLKNHRVMNVCYYFFNCAHYFLTRCAKS